MIPEPNQPENFLDGFPRYAWTDRPTALPLAVEQYASGTPIEPTTWIRATAKDVALIGCLRRASSTLT